jgi:hypothetical protein
MDKLMKRISHKVMMLIGLSLALLLGGMVVVPSYAQDGSGTVTPTPQATSTPAPLPPEFRLTGLQQAYQQRNRCSAAALDILLSYYQWQGTHTDIVRWLNPNPGDMSVRLEEMKVMVESQRPDLNMVIRTGGTLDLLRQLVVGGFPVLIETSYFNNDDSYDSWMSHNRVVMGYDYGNFYIFDPLRGSGEDNEGFAMPYYELDERWRVFSRVYVVIYRPDEEAKLQTILGDNWDETANIEWTLAQAQADREQFQDAFSAFNIAAAQTQLGRYEEAATGFDFARDLGLPKRMMWYRFEPFEAYLQVGRNEDVITVAYEVLDGTTEVEEVYYYVGRAALAMGDTERAKGNFRAALNRNEHFIEARESLTALGG